MWTQNDQKWPEAKPNVKIKLFMKGKPTVKLQTNHKSISQKPTAKATVKPTAKPNTKSQAKYQQLSHTSSQQSQVKSNATS